MTFLFSADNLGHDGASVRKSVRGWDIATLLLLVCGLLFVLLTFDVHGISNDEPVQHRYGQLLLDYYASGFTDRRAFEYINLYHYGGLFDMLAAALAPHVSMDLWDLRHLLTGVFGFSGFVATAWLGRMLGGAAGGFLAAALLALCGSWSGAMFTHTKDIPFAAATLWSVDCTTRLLQQLPRPSWRVIVATGVAMGGALGLRYGGILLPGYLALCLLLAQRAKGLSWSTLLRLWPIPVSILALMGFFWPWSVTGWDHFLITARAFSHYDLDLRTLLDGIYIPAREIPASYLFQYLVHTLPEIFLLGLASAVLLCAAQLWRRKVRSTELLYLAPLLLSLLAPFVIVLLTSPALYNGARHFTFVLPSLAVCAALGLERLIAGLTRWPKLRGAVVAVLLIFVVDAAALLWRLHPYEHVAYNRLTGGVAGAYGRWELDYWNDSMRAAVEHLNAFIERERAVPQQAYLVAICAEPVQGAHYLDRHFTVTRDWLRADFFIASTSTRCDRALEGDTIAAVTREGVPLMVVKDRRQLADHRRGVRYDRRAP